MSTTSELYSKLVAALGESYIAAVRDAQTISQGSQATVYFWLNSSGRVEARSVSYSGMTLPSGSESEP